jgi:hypothetical protein
MPLLVLAEILSLVMGSHQQHGHFPVPGAGYWMLDAGCWIIVRMPLLVLLGNAFPGHGFTPTTWLFSLCWGLGA